MSDVVVKKNTSGNTFLVNNEIEEVLSAGSADNLKIHKISENQQTIDNKIQDKIELSSNKDVGIGLELLANREKIIKKDGSERDDNEELQALDLNEHSQTEDFNNNVISFSSEDELIAKIKKLKNEKKFSNQISKKSLSFVNKFTWAKVQKEYLKLMKD